jgi:hypothetical protein
VSYDNPVQVMTCTGFFRFWGLTVMAKKKFDPATMASNWQKGMAAGGANWSQGCQGTTANIGQLAVAQNQKAASGYMKAVQPGGSWYQAMESLSLPQWKQACATAAQQGRFAQGGTKGLAKMQLFASKVAPYYAQMQMAAQSAQGWQQKVVAAIQVLVDAGRKSGSGVLSSK